jgi:hypothetical protein
MTICLRSAFGNLMQLSLTCENFSFASRIDSHDKTSLLTSCPSSLAPYERRVIELLRNSKDKRARKLAKKRLGTFGRAKKKVDELQRVIAESRRTGH